MQDVVYLKNGLIVRGTIVEEVPNISIKIKTNDGKLVVYQMTEIVQIIQEPVLKKSGKSPVLACCLSLLFPGLGQHYNGDHKKGLIQEGIYLSGVILAIAAGFDKKEQDSDSYGFDDNGDTEYEPNEIFYLGIGVAGISVLWSLIDAPIRANQINKQVLYSYGHLIEMKYNNYVLGFDAVTPPNGIASKLTLHF